MKALPLTGSHVHCSFDHSQSSCVPSWVQSSPLCLSSSGLVPLCLLTKKASEGAGAHVSLWSGGTGPCLPLVWSEVLVPGLLEGRLVLRARDWPVFWSDASPHGAWKLGHGLCHPSALPAPIKGYMGPLPLPRLPSSPRGVPQLPLPRAEVCL